MKRTLLAALAVAAGSLVTAGPAAAKVTAAEAATLGTTLTPVGAEKAGGGGGAIPAWAGGTPKSGPLTGGYPKDAAIDGDKPLYTVTKANMGQYAAKLSVGHQELLKRYDTYKMVVYPTRRTAAWPADIYAATKDNALNAVLTGTDDITGAKLGFPFPIPKTGAEVIWNHKVKWRGNNVRRYNNQQIVQPDGSSQLTKIVENVTFQYANNTSPQPMNGKDTVILKYLSQTLSPPRMAGTFILVHDKVGARDAWLYSPGLKRIRRAPTVCCDGPYEGTDGNQYYDQVDMFNGTLDLYNWKLVGKKDMIIPYNNNKLGSASTKYAMMVKPKHMNQDLPRYELHRVWVVDATVKPGKNHVLKRRTFYVDEDSWTIAAVDGYDARGQIYKFQEGFIVIAPNIQGVGDTLESIYDFQSGRYFLTAAANEDKPNDFSVSFPDSYFTPEAVQKSSLK